ncbi:HTD2 family dehydratase [Qipengyuania sp. CAU 1752]
MGAWDAWIGREITVNDRLDTGLAQRWLATFDLPPRSDGPMPQGVHLCLCTPDTPTARLGSDGHPVRDDRPDSFLPPIALPRRMWAASDTAFVAPIPIGARIERTSRIVSIAEKEGSSGPLGFVDIEHVTSANGNNAVRETQTLVYRDAAAPEAPLSPPEPGAGRFDGTAWDVVETRAPSSALLFRYSALTFNTHRIHYDLPYAREVERYRGLVVHGPLIASMLLRLAALQCGENSLARFAFRALSPAIAGEVLHLAMRRDRRSGEVEMGAFADDGRQVTKATATLA